jgi:NADPH:quinone reductase-like Zn-dependent oxidoreductase
MSASEVFAAVRKGIIKPKINIYSFNDLHKAHDDLESRKTTGSLILKF